MTTQKRKHVALYFRHARFFSYFLLLGINTFAKEVGWIVDMQSELNFSASKYLDGIICYNFNFENIKKIKEKNVPTVNLGYSPDNIDLPMVYMDNKAIAEMAVNYLLAKGFENIGYIRTPPKTICDNQRHNASKELAVEKGKRFFSLQFDTFIDQLKNIPKPVALIGENDSLTSKYLMTCYDAGYKIPFEVAFISLENDPLISEVARIPITSVDINLELRGYKAAELLNKLMNGEQPPDKTILIPPKEVVERQSTSYQAIPHLPTYKALEYIRHNYKNKRFSVSDAVKASGMCRRRLEDNFKKYVGRSMPQEVNRLRLENVKKLLLETEMKIYEISEECGFSYPELMTASFKKKFKITPRAFRKKQ